MNGLVVRVGIDSTDGCWNAPMRLASGEFAYITITETKPLGALTDRQRRLLAHELELCPARVLALV